MDKPLTHNERMELMESFWKNHCVPVLKKKGRASAPDTEGTDANYNFYALARPEFNHDEFRVWRDNFAKQWLRLENWIFSRADTAEPFEEMIGDIVNYAMILMTMLVKAGIIEPPKIKNHDKSRERDAVSVGAILLSRGIPIDDYNQDLLMDLTEQLRIYFEEVK